MNTVFTNSGNSKTLDPHKVLLNILEKINFKRSDNYVALLIFSIYYAWNNIKKSCKNNEFKTIFKTILSISSKNMKQLLIILQ